MDDDQEIEERAERYEIMANETRKELANSRISQEPCPSRDTTPNAPHIADASGNCVFCLMRLA